MLPGDRLTEVQVRELPSTCWELDGHPAHNSERAQSALIGFMRIGVAVTVDDVADGYVRFSSTLGNAYRVEL